MNFENNINKLKMYSDELNRINDVMEQIKQNKHSVLRLKFVDMTNPDHILSAINYMEDELKELSNGSNTNLKFIIAPSTEQLPSDVMLYITEKINHCNSDISSDFYFHSIVGGLFYATDGSTCNSPRSLFLIYSTESNYKDIPFYQLMEGKFKENIKKINDEFGIQLLKNKKEHTMESKPLEERMCICGHTYAHHANYHSSCDLCLCSEFEEKTMSNNLYSGSINSANTLNANNNLYSYGTCSCGSTKTESSKNDDDFDNEYVINAEHGYHEINDKFLKNFKKYNIDEDYDEQKITICDLNNMVSRMELIDINFIIYSMIGCQFKYSIEDGYVAINVSCPVYTMINGIKEKADVTFDIKQNNINGTKKDFLVCKVSAMYIIQDLLKNM